jgi:hypothetical protein
MDLSSFLLKCWRRSFQEIGLDVSSFHFRVLEEELPGVRDGPE